MMSKNFTALGLKVRLQMVSKQLLSSLKFRKNKICKKNRIFYFNCILLKIVLLWVSKSNKAYIPMTIKGQHIKKFFSFPCRTFQLRSSRPHTHPVYMLQKMQQRGFTEAYLVSRSIFTLSFKQTRIPCNRSFLCID